jgi:hypothetical protein
MLKVAEEREMRGDREKEPDQRKFEDNSPFLDQARGLRAWRQALS